LTGVRREYRRQGIATTLKLRSIAYARSLGDRILLARNESDNPMLQLNLSLGFVKESVLVMFVKTL
jgi:GNAT superfamily N-acetyltransferase